MPATEDSADGGRMSAAPKLDAQTLFAFGVSTVFRNIIKIPAAGSARSIIDLDLNIDLI